VGQSIGSVICHWDDDDWSAPTRIAEQVDVLAQSGAAVTGYRLMIFHDERDNTTRIYSGNVDYVLGTSLCYGRAWALAHPFDALTVGEDNQFVSRAARLNTLHVADGLGLMVAASHDGGTSARNYAAPSWTAMTDPMPEGFKCA